MAWADVSRSPHTGRSRSHGEIHSRGHWSIDRGWRLVEQKSRLACPSNKSMHQTPSVHLMRVVVQQIPVITLDIANRIERSVAEFYGGDFYNRCKNIEVENFGNSIAVKIPSKPWRSGIFCFSDQDVKYLKDIVEFFRVDYPNFNFYLSPMGYTKTVGQLLIEAGLIPTSNSQTIFYGVEGIVIEIMALRTSELEGKEFYEWVILFSRLPDGKPVFHKIPQKPASDTWPEKEKLTVEKLRSLSCIYLNELSRIPGSFYNGEILSAWASHDWIREELLKIFYMRSSVQFSARSKHFSEVLHPDFLSDLGSTYRYLGESALTPATDCVCNTPHIWTIG